MKPATPFKIAALPIVFVLASCYSAGDGGVDNTGGGTNQCGACPDFACAEPLLLYVSPDPAVAPANLTELETTGEGLSIECQPSSDCTAYCRSSDYQIADGHYSLTITAPGFQPEVIEFDAVNPTNCGCCGCCPFSFSQQVTLTSDGSTVETCCADTKSDPMNCGGCGLPCLEGESCLDGQCQPP